MVSFLVSLSFFLITTTSALGEICDEVMLTKPEYKCARKVDEGSVRGAEEKPIKSKVITVPVEEKTEKPEKETVLVKECPKQKPCPLQKPCPTQKSCPSCPEQKSCPAVNNYYYQVEQRAERMSSDDGYYSPLMLSFMIGSVLEPVKKRKIKGEEEWLLPSLGTKLLYFPNKNFGIGAGIYTDKFIFGEIGVFLGERRR